MTTTLLGTILIIEDSPSEMELMTHYLKESGFMVLSAVTAKQGLAIAREQKPNIILTDVVMPGMSGFELCRSLKKNPITQKIPIIICTSKNQEIDRLWGMKQGADAYITKPFSREQLVQSVMSISKSVNEFLY
ncbi:MAG: response regulator [Cyanothece sp. SIO2G6]|nr:response regulator [Cyanothece sp. SIO2G6]